MRRHVRAAALAASLAIAVLASGLAAGPASATTPEDDAANAPGFAQLGACLSSAKRLEALYVMDVSGSLVTSDPKGERFDALQTSVAELGSLVSGTDLAVEAALATFGNAYSGPESVKDWTAITDDGATATAETFKRAAETAWEGAGRAQSTDYEAALAGARDSLNARGSDDGTCRVMFWFTDGLFDLDSPAKTDAASDRMCAPDGLVSTMRADQISIIALALFNKAVADKLDDPANAGRVGELQAIAWGRDGEKTCGVTPIPEGSRSGVYLSVDDSAQLAAQFSGAIAQGRGGVPVPVEGLDPVVVDVAPGVRQFEVDVTSGTSPSSVTVTPPNGAPVDVAADGQSHDVPGGRVLARSYGALLVATVSMPGSGTQGPWHLQVDGATAANAYVYSGLTLTIQQPAKGELKAGEAGTVTVLATDLDGQPADLGVYGDVRPEAIVAEPGSADAPTSSPMVVSDVTAGRLEVPVTPADDIVALRVQAQVTPTLTDGTVLATTTARDTVAVTLPASFPAITPAADLDLGQMDGIRPASGTLSLTGSPDGPTQVCLVRVAPATAPERAGKATFVVSPEPTPEGCYALAAGEQRIVTVSVLTESSADGTGSTVIDARLRAVPDADGASAEARNAINVTWTMSRPVDNGRRLVFLLLAMLIAIALPIVVLLLLNRFLARFKQGNLQYARREVRITDAGLETVDGRPLLLRDRLDYDYVGRDKTRRILAPGAGMFTLVAKASWNPFGGPRFEAVAADGWQVVGADSARHASDGRSTAVSPGLGAVVVLAVADEQARELEETEPIPAIAVLITRATNEDTLDELALRVQERFDWPTLRARLRGTADRRSVAATGSNGDATPVAPVLEDDDPLGGTWHGPAISSPSRPSTSSGTRDLGSPGAAGPAATSQFDKDDPLA